MLTCTSAKDSSWMTKGEKKMDLTPVDGSRALDLGLRAWPTMLPPPLTFGSLSLLLHPLARKPYLLLEAAAESVVCRAALLSLTALVP